jgi:hypothetical protein
MSHKKYEVKLDLQLFCPVGKHLTLILFKSCRDCGIPLPRRSLSRCLDCHRERRKFLVARSRQRASLSAYFERGELRCRGCGGLVSGARRKTKRCGSCAKASKKASNADSMTRWLANNREKRRAHDMLGKHVARGNIVRPNRCERCEADCKPDAHHADYNKPLEVEWLCRSCHTSHHETERAASPFVGAGS